MIVLMAGLPGCGKSTMSRTLADRLAGVVLSKDKIRYAMFAPADIEYSRDQDDFCMEVMLRAAEYLLRKDSNRYIFLDGRTFSRTYQIDRVLSFAENIGQPWQILECVCTEEIARTRLSQTEAAEHPAANRNYDLYLRVKQEFEKITRPKTIIDTEDPLETCVQNALSAIE